MIDQQTETKIVRLFQVEKWPVGTISSQLEVHHDVVERVLRDAGIEVVREHRPSTIDPYLPFILEKWKEFPTLTAARLHVMCQERGYQGHPDHFRHMVARHRPHKPAEAFQRLKTLPAEQGQVDWGHFGRVQIGHALRALIAFVMVLSWSRKIFLRFFFGQDTATFLHAHQLAFKAFKGVPRVLLYDNLKSAVLERRGNAILFNPELLAFAQHYRFEPRPVAPACGPHKGRVERAIRYVRSSFFTGRTFTTLEDLNAAAAAWAEGPSAMRRWPEDHTRTVAEAFAEEQPRLLSLPENPLSTEQRVAVPIGKTPYARFDLNDYSVPHEYVQRTVTILASQDLVRIVDGDKVIAEHARSYDKGKQIEDPKHIEALRAYKSAGREHRDLDRLAKAAPSSEKLFERVAERGLCLRHMQSWLLKLLDQFGETHLEEAIREALACDVVHHHGILQILDRRRAQEGKPPAIQIVLPEDPRIRDMTVRPHPLSDYDEIARSPEAQKETPDEQA